MNNIVVLVFAFALVALTVCCSTGTPEQLAEREVSNFRRQFDAEDYGDIYSRADEEFRKQGSEAELTKNMSFVREKLGESLLQPHYIVQ